MFMVTVRQLFGSLYAKNLFDGTGSAPRTGDLLIEADLDAIEAAGKPTATMVIVTNSDAFSSIKANVGPIKAGQASCTFTK